MPFNVFGTVFDTFSRGLYDKFCDEAANDQKKHLFWTVAANGDQKTAPPRRRKQKRTPPADPDDYDSYSIDLTFEPGTASHRCSKSCKEAYLVFPLSPCGHQGGTQNIMTAEASIDVGCGTYSYKITGEDVPPPSGPPEPALSERYCYPHDAFGKHADIDPDLQVHYAMENVCAGTTQTTIKRDDPETRINWHTETNGAAYNYTMAWQSGCESSVSEMNVWKPLIDNDATCEDLMVDNFENCEFHLSYFAFLPGRLQCPPCR